MGKVEAPEIEITHCAAHLPSKICGSAAFQDARYNCLTAFEGMPVLPLLPLFKKNHDELQSDLLTTSRNGFVLQE